MDRTIDRDYARMMTEMQAARQDWHNETPVSRKFGLLQRLINRR